MNAGQHLDEGRFASAVLAEQRDDLAGRDREVDVVDGEDGGKRLGQAAHD